MAMNEELVKALKEGHLTIGSVESFTGGMFASSIVSVPGASEVYLGSLVTYVPEAKAKLAGVEPRLIAEKGVVSQEVAMEMARGGKKAIGADIVVSFTGDAGPTTEEKNDKVGECYICISSDKNCIVLHPRFSGTRDQIRKAAVDLAMEYVLRNIEKGTIGKLTSYR